MSARPASSAQGCTPYTLGDQQYAAAQDGECAGALILKQICPWYSNSAHIVCQVMKPMIES